MIIITDLKIWQSIRKIQGSINYKSSNKINLYKKSE